jgi:DNA polymerase (family 10)
MSATAAPLPYDGHVHTSASDGRNSLGECVRAAEAAGLRCLAITDHFYRQPEADLEAWVRAIAQADAASHVTVVPGVEAIILDTDGDLSLTRDDARLLRWVIADFGTRTTGIGSAVSAFLGTYLANVERAMVNAARNPLLDAVAHPFHLGRWEACLNPEDLPDDMLRRIAEAMATEECAFEVSNQAYWWHPDVSVDEYLEQMARVLRIFSEAGVLFTVGSDAHSVCGVGNLGFALRLLAAGGIGRDQLVDLEALNDRRRHEQATGRRLL